MGQSLKAVIQLISICSGVTAFILWSMLWMIPDESGGRTLWITRIALTLLCIGACTILVRNSRRKEILPDMLAAETGLYFERDGFCFGAVPIAIAGISWMQVYFHNRYARSCVARVVIQPPGEYFLGKQAPLAGIDVDIECDGAAFGVCRVPWPVPGRLQGKKTKFEVAATVTYPSGRGKLMRFREGLRVGTPGGGLARAATTGGLLLVGVISISSPARLTLTLPINVSEQSPATAGVWTEILYRPDAATAGLH